MSVPSGEDQVRFLVNTQRLLDEGKTTSTYKFAVLLALAQASVERGDDSGGPLQIETRELAKQIIRQYWDQVIPFVPADGRTAGRVLKQIRRDEAVILAEIEGARPRTDGSLSLLMRDLDAWSTVVTSVATTIERYPLRLLQNVGGEQLRFLYSTETLRNHRILLNPGVAYCFRRFHPLIQSLVQGAWIRFIRRIKENQDLVGGGNELGEFLFGSERTSLAEFQPILRDVQAGRCFYCRRALTRGVAVDHFVPWSRYSLDLGHNFVLAHDRCNARKSDRLAAATHLEHWCGRNVEFGSELAERFDEKGLVHDLPASRQIATWAYGQAQDAGAQVWYRGDELVPLDARWRGLPGIGSR